MIEADWLRQVSDDVYEYHVLYVDYPQYHFVIYLDDPDQDVARWENEGGAAR